MSPAVGVYSQLLRRYSSSVVLHPGPTHETFASLNICASQLLSTFLKTCDTRRMFEHAGKHPWVRSNCASGRIRRIWIVVGSGRGPWKPVVARVLAQVKVDARPPIPLAAHLDVLPEDDNRMLPVMSVRPVLRVIQAVDDAPGCGA